MVDRIYPYDMPKVCPVGASELSIQRSCLDLVAKTYRQTRVVAVPNGTNIKSHAGRRRVAAEGLSKGFPDLIVIGHYGQVAFIELKAMGTLSEEQHAWLTDLIETGHMAGCFRSVGTFDAALRGWGFK